MGLEWHDRYLTGIATIDTQHKAIFEYLQDLYISVENTRGRDIHRGILDGLVKYTDTHFKYEESLFEKFHYQLNLEHKNHHLKLYNDVLDFKGRMLRSETFAAFEIADFLKKWLFEHILAEDFKYRQFMGTNGVR